MSVQKKYQWVLSLSKLTKKNEGNVSINVHVFNIIHSLVHFISKTDLRVRKKLIALVKHIHLVLFVFVFEQAVGYGIIAVTFALQPLMKWACGRLKGVWRIAVADLFLLLSFVGTANVWRGLWAILDIHFIPSK